MFKVSDTFKNPTRGGNAARGFPSPGAGAQLTGDPMFDTPIDPYGEQTTTPSRPTKGIFSWLFPSKPASEQRGFPEPEGDMQERVVGSMPNSPHVFGGVYQNYTPYYSRGAAAFVPNFGRVLYNPIGAGVVAKHRTQASYGKAGQYANGAIWWSNKIVPTSIHMQGLNSPQEIADLLSTLEIQAVIRTTG
jgi:hypothetical protein